MTNFGGKQGILILPILILRTHVRYRNIYDDYRHG